MNTTLKQRLKADAHHLHPVVMIGAKGLTPAIIAETDIALETHELLKVKINGAEKAHRHEMAEQLCTALHATLVQLIGNIAVLYRKRTKP